MNETTTVPRPAPQGQRSPGRPVRPGRVLLAEDDSEMRVLLAGALLRDGYDVIEAIDGKSMLDRLADSAVLGRSIDFIVTDVRMPRLSGLQALMLVRKITMETPVIVITAFGDRSTHRDARLLGASAVLDKPFDIPELLTLMHKLGKRPR